MLNTTKYRDLAKRNLPIIIGGALVLLITTGLFAQLGWFPKTDEKTGDRSGWFGMKIAKESPSSNWNPLAEPAPPFVPTLSKEYIYAGDRMLAVEDYAQPTPPITPTPTPGGGSWGTPAPTPTPGGGSTPTPTPTPPSGATCSAPRIVKSKCVQDGGTWNNVTCNCDF